MIKKNIETRQAEVKKKLSSVRDIRELKKLFAAAQIQNKKLVDDIRDFRDRVNTLMAKRDEKDQQIEESNQVDPRVVTSEQKLLKKKYAQMNELKKELEKARNDELQDVKNTKQKWLNEQANVQKRIREYKKERQDLLAVEKKLVKTQKDWEKEDNVNEPKIVEFQKQNKKLREEMNQIIKKGYVKQYQSIKVQTTLFTTKKKVRDNEMRKNLSAIKAEPTTNKVDVLAECEKLKNQVKQLKKQVQTIEHNEEVQKQERLSIKEKLKKQSKDRVNTMRTLEMRKSKAQRENNMMRKKWLDICKQQEKLKNKVKKVENGCQVDQYVDEEPLRRQYSGVLGRNRADDRFILKDNKTAKVVGLTVYETERGLVGIQAHYDSNEVSSLPFTNYFLAKCKVTKINAGEEDFFKLFKVKYNSLQNRVIKFETRSNRNVRYQYGDKRAFGEISEGDIVYGFDIRIHEYPVCIFSSYVFSKGNYHMEGFGVEINNLQ